MKSNYFKDPRNGHEAKTVVELNAKQVLAITTRRTMNGDLSTNVFAYWLGADGSMRHSFDFGAGGGDFSYTFRTTRPSRLTEKLVREQHELAEFYVPGFIEKANAFYLNETERSFLPTVEA